MALPIRAGTANTLNLGPALNIGTGVAMGSLNLAPSAIFLSKNGSIFAAKADTNTAYPDRSGWYKVPVDAADTGTGGRLIVQASPTSCLELWQEYEVLPAIYYDALYAGATSLNVLAVAASSPALQAHVIATGNSVWQVAARALTDKAGFSLAADQSAVTIGTLNALAAGAITAAAIATNAIDADAIAADAVTEIQAGLALQAGLIAVGNSVWETPTRALTDKAGFSLAADQSGVTVGTVNALAANAINAAAIATNAVDADALAADAVTEIQAGLALQAGLIAVGNSVWNTPSRFISYAEAASIPGFSFQAVANSVWAHILTGTLQAQQIQRGLIAVMAGKSSGGNTDTIRFRDIADTKDVVVATMNTATGDRLTTTVTLT